jgi:hypothetical protein
MSNETKQTAIELFAISLYEKGFLTGNGDEIQELLEQFKQMEKEQMIKIYHEYQDYLDYEFKNQQGGQGVILTFEQFYNETYGGNK